MQPDLSRIALADVELALHAFGQPEQPPLIMLHGMRDTAASLFPIARRLASRYRVWLPDLRGHGRSGQPGVYRFDDLLFDLYQLVEQLAGGRCALWGQSLGGQLAARFAGIWPDRVAAAVLVEGLGPPDRPMPVSAAARVRTYGERLLQARSRPRTHRPLGSLEYAAGRLLANNPRLTEAAARELAHWNTRRLPGGDLVWAFDPQVETLFLGFREDERDDYWSSVQAPVLIVAGTVSHEYWRQAIPAGEGWTGRFQPGELERRAAIFPHHELVMLENAGHMAHYDQPDRLADLSLRFLEQHHV